MPELIEAANLSHYGKIYLFGSILKCSSCASDIDLLVVYNKGEIIESLKINLSELSLRYPLDITYMTANEERQFKFIENQGAVSIEDLAP